MEHLRYYILLNCITFLTFNLHNYNYNKNMRLVIYIIFYLDVSIKLIIIINNICFIDVIDKKL